MPLCELSAEQLLELKRRLSGTRPGPGDAGFVPRVGYMTDSGRVDLDSAQACPR